MATVEELEKELADTKAKAEENVKALQQKLTEKDQEIKKTLAEFEATKGKSEEDSEAVKQIKALTETVGKLTNQISDINTDKRKQELQAKFPDIMPEFLLGKSDEEAEIIYNKQKELTMKNYDEKASAHAPIYKDRGEIDAEIERVKEDKSLSTENKLTKVRELKLRKDEL